MFSPSIGFHGKVFLRHYCVVAELVVSEARTPEFKCQLCHTLPVCFGAHDSTCLCFDFLICKIGMKRVLVFQRAVLKIKCVK